MIKNRNPFRGSASALSCLADANHRFSYPPNQASGPSDPKSIFAQAAPISGFGLARASDGLLVRDQTAEH
jgi:hypothetical protein